MVEDISIFINLQSKPEGIIFRDVNSTYNFKEPSGNIEQIDGVVVSMKDWKNVSNGLQWRQSTTEEVRRPLYDRELIIDPDLWQLFRGYGLNAERLFKTNVFSLDARRAYDEISTERNPKNKLSRQISEIYPKLDKEYVEKTLKFQKGEGASLIISPSPPITSAEHLESQLQKMQEMNKISKEHVDSGLLDGNLANVITLDPDIFKLSGAREKILKAISTPKVDIIGIKLLDLSSEDMFQAREILNLIKNIRERAMAKRIYLFNVSEFGYVAHCYGVNTIVMPIGAKSPYTRRRKRSPRPSLGTYYHPKDMINYTYKDLLVETRSQNYKFPCHCKVCKKFGSITKVEKEYWNNFRRIHFLLVKNMDIVELRSTTAPLDKALLDKFSLSKQTMWIPLLQM